MNHTPRKPRPRGRGLTLLLLTPLMLTVLRFVGNHFFAHTDHPASFFVYLAVYLLFAVCVIILLARLIGRGCPIRILAVALTLVLAADFAVIYLPYSESYTDHMFRRYRAERAEAVAEIMTGDRDRMQIDANTFTVRSMAISCDHRIYIDREEIVAVFTLHKGIIGTRVLIYAPGKAINEKLTLPAGLSVDNIRELSPGWAAASLVRPAVE